MTSRRRRALTLVTQFDAVGGQLRGGRRMQLHQPFGERHQDIQLANDAERPADVAHQFTQTRGRRARAPHERQKFAESAGRNASLVNVLQNSITDATEMRLQDLYLMSRERPGNLVHG